MSRIFPWILFLTAVGVFVYVFQTQVRVGAMELYKLALPCTLPESYRIGSIDPRFGISTSTLEKDLAIASGLWNKAAKKNLFLHDQENGVLTVNLVYDSRQEMTKRLHQLGVTLSNDRATYDSLRAKYDALYATYTRKKEAFESHIATFNTAKTAYEERVEYWNTRGGAPKAEYEALQTQQRALNAQSKALQEEQDSLNATAQGVNDLARALNQLIASLKLDVDRYNTTGSSQGDSFEQGVYERELGVETITIFEYENNALLTRVLAHELGHSIGLDHVEDPEAIMYYLNQGEDIALTPSDHEELKTACRLK